MGVGSWQLAAVGVPALRVGGLGSKAQPARVSARRAARSEGAGRPSCIAPSPSSPWLPRVAAAAAAAGGALSFRAPSLDLRRGCVERVDSVVAASAVTSRTSHAALIGAALMDRCRGGGGGGGGGDDGSSGGGGAGQSQRRQPTNQQPE
ncbi:hypothetical protein PLESTB_000937200 [Pleodorina starrii]|uniref:Uncharacterized protein n=1 Tax=Pleodorina starrii TaxID=330485 RepID=A0A9W6BMX7_9CHLO|nr:hypothetical protein PLESTM_000707600 [Pleodorina starrii]GLC55039.1 hypothetical protein PLESTB_000937200 [Pleodorina starrii]GLC71201.1 hypothetical protein PLESTF_001085200 [Pleodorina starrii]